VASRVCSASFRMLIVPEHCESEGLSPNSPWELLTSLCLVAPRFVLSEALTRHVVFTVEDRPAHQESLGQHAYGAAATTKVRGPPSP
jgi:hypothetical protein